MVNSTRLGCAALLVALFPWAVVVAQPPKPAPAAGNRTAKSRPAAGTPAAKPSPSPAAKPSPSPAAPAPPVATPTPAEALKLQPIQKQIDYDVPDAQAAEKCTLSCDQGPAVSGWEVRSGDGNMLRRFLDTNGDNKVDQWCYYKDGVEVYRDIDSNFNRKADEYRWLGTAGIRWAVDTNEDGHIDGWKVDLTGRSLRGDDRCSRHA